MFLAVAAAVLVLVCLLIGNRLDCDGCLLLSKAYTARRRYDLVERALDRDKIAGLKEVTEAIRDIDGDLRWGPRAGDNIVRPDDPLNLNGRGNPPRQLPVRWQVTCA